MLGTPAALIWSVAFSLLPIATADPSSIGAVDTVGPVIPAQQVREDLAYLFETLRESSYDLFYNADEAALQEAYSRLLAGVRAPMDRLSVNRMFQRLVAQANLAHAGVEFPWEEYGEYYRNGGLLFPLELTFFDGLPRIAIDYSGNDIIEPGDVLIDIGGRKADQVLREVRGLLSGENVYARNAMLELQSFVHYHWLAFGAFDGARVTVRKGDGRLVGTEVRGVSLDEYRARREEVRHLPMMLSGRTFEFIGDVAYLRPGDFLNQERTDATSLEAMDSGEFLEFVSRAFSEIFARKPHGLILDLRGNNGGDNSFSDPMLAYIADEPFAIASSFRVRTSRLTKAFWRDVDVPALEDLRGQILSLEDGTRFEAALHPTEPRPDSLRFHGQVYALVNRFSFSNAAVVAAIIQDYGFGTIVGEETSYTPSSCAAIHTFQLPTTGFEAWYPKACSIRPNGDPTLRGVLPDHALRDDPFTDEDEMLEGVLALIGSSNDRAR